MYQPAVCLQGEAARSGFEIIDVGQREALAFRMDVGAHVWTEKSRTPYTLFSRTDGAEEAAVTILNAKTDNQLGALTSQFGVLAAGHIRERRGGECVPLDALRQAVGDLRRLNDLLVAGNFTEANPLPNGMVMSPFAVAFNLWLVPDEASPNFSVQFMTYSLYSFLVHELITRALGNRPLLVCAFCRDYQRAARRDRLFCSGRCRTAHSRLLHDKQITANLRARSVMQPCQAAF